METKYLVIKVARMDIIPRLVKVCREVDPFDGGKKGPTLSLHG